MINRTILLLFGCCVFINAAAQVKTTTTTEKELIAISQKLLDAIPLGDTATWKLYLTDSTILVNWEGVTKRGAHHVKQMRPLPSRYKFISNKVTNPRVYEFGNTAIISFLANEKLEVYGQVQNTPYNETDTYVKSNGQWKLIASMFSEVVLAPPPSVRVDEEVLKNYTGTYAVNKNVTSTFSIKNGRLLQERSGGTPRELFAEAESVFFSTDRLRNRLFFEKDTSGKVVRMVDRRLGYDLVWEKVK